MIGKPVSGKTLEISSEGLVVVAPEHYERGGELARGGLGRLVVARDRRMGRSVAIKELIGHDAGPSDEARFVREALITGGLAHPSIVPVHEAGRWPDGRPFYAMKLVEGESLAEVIARRPTLRDRLKLLPHLVAVCDAMAYAHARRVIHRDLKPQNILVGAFGETVVVDWGVAKLLGEPDEPAASPRTSSPRAGDTVAGEVIGTPAYMPPEQGMGKPVDERADVFALGGVAYHVLAGVAPYGSPGAPAEAILGSPPPLASRVEGVPPELLAIVEKAMARKPEDRYPSARELAEDLRNFELGKLVSSYAYSPWALARRFFWRHRVAVAAIAAAALTLAVLGGVALQRIVRERDAAAAAERVAVARAHELVLLQARSAVPRDPTAALAWLKLYPPGGPRWDVARSIVTDALNRRIARHVWRAPDAARAVAISRDARTVAVASVDHQIYLWDVASGKRRVLSGHADAVQAVAFSADGAQLASGANDGRIVVWELASGEHRIVGQHDNVVRDVAFSVDGRSVAAGGFDSQVIVWPVGEGEKRVFTGHALSVNRVRFLPDGKTLYSVAWEGDVRLWDLATGNFRRIDGLSRDTVLSEDGSRLAWGSDGVVSVMQLQSGGVLQLDGPPNAQVRAISADGTTVAALAPDGRVHLVDALSGRTQLLAGHAGELADAAFAADGTVATATDDGEIRVWPPARAEGRVLRGLDKGATAVTWEREGGRIAGGGSDGRILVWSGDGAPQLFEGHRGSLRTLAFRPRGGDLVSLGNDRTVRLWDSPAGRTLFSSELLIRRIRMAPDGRRLAAVEGFVAVTVLSLPGGEVVCRLEGRDIVGVAWAPDGDALYYGTGSEVRRVEMPGCSQKTLYRHESWIHRVAVSDDGALVLSAGNDRAVAAFDQASGRLRMMHGHTLEVSGLAIPRAADWVASASFDRTIRIWDPRQGTERRVLRGHEGSIRVILATADGTRLVSYSQDQTVRIWDVATGVDRAYRGHEAEIFDIALGPGDREAVSAAADGKVIVWPAIASGGLPVEGPALLRSLDEATTATIDADDRMLSPAR